MRFASGRDYGTILHMNRELVNTVVDTPVVIYKINIQETKTNLYGEADTKVHYTGVQIAALIRRDFPQPENETGVLDFDQVAEFALLRKSLDEKNFYPEVGDVIEFDSQYYEINNIAETQLFAGQALYNHSIVCTCHLMRRVPSQLESTIL